VRPPAGSLPAPLGPYSPAVWAGDTLYVSGMGGQEPATRQVIDSVTGQVAQTLANVTTTLTAAGLSHADVVSVQAYGTRLSEATALGEALHAGLGTRDVPTGQVVLPRLPGPIRAELTFVAARANQMRERVAGASRVLRAGNTAYVAADVAADRGADVQAETRALLQRLRTLLRGVRMDLRQVAHVTVYLSDIADLPAVNAVYKEVFPDDPPARATVQVQPLGSERVRIAMIAAQ
jgi:2-iminobutanoate/2-iminopropanoate deaminase